MPSRRITIILFAVLAAACGPAATEVPDSPSGTVIRAIHITRNGVEAGATIRTGALGGYVFDVVLEHADGTLHPRGDRRVTWGSTNPAVADGLDPEGAAYIHFFRNGEAKLIAQLEGLRDTVSLEIAQVAVAGRMSADTLVTLSSDARDLSGAPSAYHGFRYAAVRVDSNGYAVNSTEAIHFDAGNDPLFQVVSEPRGDTISVLGIRGGIGTLVTRFETAADSVPVQIANAYRVVRLIETPSGARRTSPDTLRIPAGAAVIFQNETRGLLRVDGPANERIGWRAGPLQPNGREPQIFSLPGTYPFFWGGGEGTIIVTP
jgi:hypothetical protein